MLQRFYVHVDPMQMVTCTIDKKGTMRIDATAEMIQDGATSKITDREFALAIIGHMKNKNIRNISSTDLVPGAADLIGRYKRAAELIETVMLSPYTCVGRKRLEREYFTLVVDDK